jgi:hypothetical protein
MPSCSILVAHRDPGGGERDRLWKFVRAAFEAQLSDVEIVVGTDDGENPFHKTLALNRAAREAQGEVFGIWDSDTWVAADMVRVGIAWVAETGRWCRPWTKKIRLNEAQTEHVLARGPWWDSVVGPDNGRPEGINTFWAAPPLLVHRETFERLGGMDERFRGWGSEDVAFARALVTEAGSAGVVRGRCHHLWHPRRGRSGNDLWEGQTSTKANEALAAEYRTVRRGDRRRIVMERPDPTMPDPDVPDEDDPNGTNTPVEVPAETDVETQVG